jgi:outer membrane protein assembly factor BamE
MQSKMSLIIVSFMVLATAACSNLRFPGVFRIDIAQGNQITPEMIEKLRVGMTPGQVEYVMGSPMLVDPFVANRWDYLYRLQSGKGELKENRITLFFENERLSRIDLGRYQIPQISNTTP